MRAIVTRSALLLVGVLVLVGGLSIWQGGWAQAARGDRLTSSFGMVGLDEGQFARLNAVNIGNPDTLPPNPCGLVFRFVDASGEVVKRDTKRIAPGKAVHLDLPYADVSGRDGRVQIRADVSIGNPDILPACLEIIPTLEVVDRESGRTLVVLGLTPKLVAPPEPE